MVLVSYVDAVWAMNPYSGHLLLVFLSTVILFVSFFLYAHAWDLLLKVSGKHPG